MEEQLVSFETAKLAKEKEFDIRVINYYTPEGYCTKSVGYMSERFAKQNWNSGQGSYPTDSKDILCSAPTQGLLQKWLREVCKINVYCLPTETNNNEWYYNSTINGKQYHSFASSFRVHTGSYEEVLESGLQEALKLISNSVKNK